MAQIAVHRLGRLVEEGQQHAYQAECAHQDVAAEAGIIIVADRVDAGAGIAQPTDCKQGERQSQGDEADALVHGFQADPKRQALTAMGLQGADIHMLSLGFPRSMMT